MLLPGLKDKTTNITPFILVAVFLTLVTMSIIGITIWNIIVLHRREYSITAKKAQFVVQEGFEQIIVRCLAAALNMGAHVTNLGGFPGEFLIYAELERGRLKIQVGKSREVSMPCWIEVQSDSYLPMVVWDHGINAKNLFAFIDEYFKVQPQ